MNSSTQGTEPAESPKKSTAASAEEIESNRRAARQDALELRKLAKQKAALKGMTPADQAVEGLNELAAEVRAKEEGLRQLAKQKAGQKAPNQAA
jgi:hypothetical protein